MPYKSTEQPNTVFLSRKLLETHLRLPNPQPGLGHRIRVVLPRKEQTSPSPDPHGASRWQPAFAYTSCQGKLLSRQEDTTVLEYFPRKASSRLHSVQKDNSLSFIHGKLSFPNFTFVHTVTQGVEGDRQLLQSNYTDHEDASIMKESEHICSCKLLFCIRGHLQPKPALLFYISCVQWHRTGHSSLADRVLQVMAKLPSWHCPKNLLLCACSWILVTHIAGLNRHSQSAQATAGVAGPGAPKPVLGKLHRAWKWQQFSTSMALTGMLIKLAAGQVLQSQINTRLG